MSVVWHSLLTTKQTRKIENIQKTSLKIILGPDYPTGFQWCGLSELSPRRKTRCLAFAKTSLRYPVGERMFPLNSHHDLNVRSHEKYKVNFAHTENYRKSTVPYCQRLLNDDIKAREAAASSRSGEGGARAGTVQVARRREEGV